MIYVWRLLIVLAVLAILFALLSMPVHMRPTTR